MSLTPNTIIRKGQHGLELFVDGKKAVGVKVIAVTQGVTELSPTKSGWAVRESNGKFGFTAEFVDKRFMLLEDGEGDTAVVAPHMIDAGVSLSPDTATGETRIYGDRGHTDPVGEWNPGLAIDG